MPDLLPARSAAGWVLIFLGGKLQENDAIQLFPGESDPRTFTASFGASGKPLSGELLAFAFPPGKGMVTLANVQLLRQR